MAWLENPTELVANSVGVWGFRGLGLWGFRVWGREVQLAFSPYSSQQHMPSHKA